MKILGEKCVFFLMFQVQPQEVSKITFYSGDRECKRKKQYTEASDEEFDTFLAGLAKVKPSTVCLSSFDQYNDRFIGRGPKVEKLCFPMNLRNLYKIANLSLNEEQLAHKRQEVIDTINVVADKAKTCSEALTSLALYYTIF